MVEYLVLGLLLYKPQTMYEIKKIMEKSTNHFFSASFGSLHPALKKLDDKGWVEFTQTLEQGRGKKTFAITEAGKDAFLKWLQFDSSTDIVREPSLLKMFFLGHLNKPDQMPILHNYLLEIQKNLEVLSVILQAAQDMEVSQQHLDHKRYQLATLEFGIAYYEFVLEWYRKKFPDLETAKP